MAGAEQRGGAGAEVTGGNWCDEHVWPPPPLPPAPPPPPHMCHKHGTRLSTTTTMHHWQLACVANAWNRADSGAQQWPQSAESRMELRVSEHQLLCRQTVRPEITFTLQDILILYEA